AKNHQLPKKWVTRLRQKSGIFRVKLACRITSQFRVMARGSDRVKAQSVDSRIQTEAHLVEHRGGNFRVLPVQIRLASQEMMQIVLLTSRFPLPGRSAERGYPVIWL